MAQHRAIAYLQWPTNKKSYMIYRTAPFLMTLHDPCPGFKVTLFFNAECLKKRYEIQT